MCTILFKLQFFISLSSHGHTKYVHMNFNYRLFDPTYYKIK